MATAPKKKPPAKKTSSKQTKGEAKTLTEAQRVKALVAGINKKFGTNTVVAGAEGDAVQVRTISTRNATFDSMTGCGGIPRGRIIEMFGEAGVGKTTLLGQAIAEVHRQGGRVAYLEPENKLNKPYYKNLGVDLENEDRWFTAQDSACEIVLPVAATMAGSGLYDIVAIDAMGALGIASAQPDGGEDVIHDIMKARGGDMLVRASLISEHLSNVHVHPRTAYVLINHSKKSISGKTQPGGGAIKLHSCMRIEVDKLWHDKKVIGARCRSIKNQMGGRTYEWHDLPWAPVHDTGYDVVASYVILAPDTGVINKNGSYHYWTLPGEDEPTQIGNGWSNATSWFEERPEMFDVLRKQVDTACGWVR